MDQNSEIINVFESLLMTRSTKVTTALYTRNEHQNKTLNITQKKYSAREVLTNVSKQLKAIQNADAASHKRVGNKLDKYKKREFLPIEKIPVYKEVHKNIPTKFETQCVTDTQLINVIENAEIIDGHRGVTQEFDETFCQKSDEDDCDNKINDGSLKPDKIADTVIVRSVNSTFVDKEEEMKECNDISNQDSKLFEKSDLTTCEMPTVTCQENYLIGDLNDRVNINPSQETQAFNKGVLHESKVNEERSTSPVLNAIKRNSTPPLVVNLYAFEEFENLVHPIIEEQKDFEIAKNLINSQILGREISISEHVYESFHRESPVLNKMECITTNMNKDDLNNVNTHSDEYIDGNIICNQGNCSSSENKEMQSKIIKAEIKDEILFSSDEEYEYLHKDVQELPLTCALETSFYDKSDVLDKTMYVGFQTASNKSIQIHTDSFMRAKSILSSMDSENTEATVKDLVEIFESGKAVNDNVQNTALTSCKQEYDTENKYSLKLELDNNEDFTLVSKDRGEDEEKIGDTFKNVSLTALEQEANVNDDIVMSQVITCKSNLRSVKENNNIIFEDTTTDTLNTAIEQNKHLDDDIIMSQVIEFKSISKTPKSFINTSINNIFKKPKELNTKRKLEGFKTASNKKIKLSEKAMARCKKVFQDIDLNETDCLSNSESKKELNNGEIQPKIEDLDLQITDKIILQEFEDTEMSFEIRHNNAYVGFKTASNKNISISDAALAKTKNLFQDIMNTNTENDYLKESAEKCTNIFHKPVIDFKKVIGKQTQCENAKTKTINEDAIALGIKEDNRNIHIICKPPKRDFSGFKTAVAANKEIKSSDQALEKSKDFYKDFDEHPTKNSRDKEILISNMEKGNFNHVEEEFNCEIDTQDFLAEELTHLEDLFKDNAMEKKKSLSPTLHGFQTASKKPVIISKIALEKGRKFFEDITNKESNLIDITNIQRDGNSNEAKTSENDYPIEQETGFALVQPAVKETVSEITLEDKTRFVHKSDSKQVSSDDPIFTGFKTASSKPITVSAASMENTKRILTEFELKDDEVTVDNNSKHTIEPKPSTSTFVGFLTASNKNIKISAKALAKSRQMMNDFEVKDDFLEAGKNTSTKNFPNRLIDHHETSIFGIKANDNITPSTRKFIGFQTASNKEIKISNEALARSKVILEDHISEKEKDLLNEVTFEPEGKASPEFKGFQTANNKKVSISEKALEESKRVFQDIDTDNYLKDENHEGAPIFRGFQTASNKNVAISEKALAKSKKLFEDISLSQIDKFPETNHLRGSPIFKGFQTASNKKVEISEEALANSKQLFKDIKFNQVGKDPEIINLDDAPVFTEFQTASNKKVEISEQALVKTKQIFEDIKLSQIDKETTNLENAPVFKGFQTASNKNVEISEKALAKSKKLFEDIKLSQLEKDREANHIQESPVFKGFQTASNKEVEISEQALAGSKQLLEDIKFSQVDKDPETTNLEDAPVFKGFKTASNKKVKISEKALAKSKQLFEDIKLSQIDKYPETTNLEDARVVKGFQTASNKKVPISEKALAKCKQVFEGLSQLEKDPKMTVDLNDLPVANENNDATYKTNEPFGNYHFKGFETGSNKKVKVSQQALAKTKKIFKDIHEGIKTSDVNMKNHSNVVSRIPNNNLIKTDNVTVESSTEIANALIKDVIDSQVLNDFQDTQNTEDFCKSTPKSKRSGSPILSCPRAKKRKFETPYRTKKKIEPLNTFVPPKVSKTFNFNAEYKKEKKYTLKDLEILEREHIKIEINPYIAEFKFDTLQNFKFFDTRNDYTEGTMTIEELKNVFLDSVNKKIVPEGWLDNHIKLILWKLLSYEIKCPNVMKNTCTVRNVLEQLKYRYERELYHVQRPILRKILEKDEVASKTMILCVAEIYVDNIRVTSVSPTAQNMELLLTDGWYCVKATTDRMLVRLAANGSIVVGTKLAVCGAELINCEQGVAPWEDTSSVRLKLSGNSVRRARWLTPLGVRTGIVRSPLRAVRVDGGRVAALRVVVTRVYPPLYVEKMEDGSTVTLSERLERVRQTKYESERQVVMEKLYEEVEKEMSDQDTQDSEGFSNERSGLESGSQISKCMKRSKDPDEYRSHLTKSQNRMLEEHSAIQREKLIERVRVKFQEKLDKTGLKIDRNVIPLLKVRIAGLVEKDGVEVTKGYLSIWRPSAAVLELLTEGAWIEILNIIPTGIRNSEIQLSTGRQTVFNPYKQTNDKFKLYTNTLKRKCYEIRELTHNPSMTTDYNEIDIVGIIFCIEPSTKEFNGNQYFQNVYLADADKNIICVNFWGGLKKFGFENVLDTGEIVTCVNLQKRAGNTRKSIPEYRVTEFSYFTKTPKDKKALVITNELSKKLSKIKEKFCEDCVVLKNNYSVFKTRNNENDSPYSNCNVKMVSPLKNDLNLNLTGLDFDTSFDTQDISPQMLLRKKKINEKIEKIRLYYGEPPPLSSIHIVNQSKNASANYKSPLVLNSERKNVANVQNTALVESPVSMNRTFVKNINPVKLNFSNASLNDNVDHFAEEFDASPPLSLDSETLN